MVKDTLFEIEQSLEVFIDYLRLKSQADNHILDYLKYVEQQFMFFKENQEQRDENGVLKVYSLGQSISRFADEFDWGEYSNKRELNNHLEKLCELIIKLDSEK